MKIMHDLFVRYLNNDCSPEEVKQILAHFNVPKNEEMLRSLIIETLEEDADQQPFEWSPKLDESFATIKDQINTEEVKVVPISKRTWFRVAAAAVILIGVFNVYRLISNKDQNQDLVKTSSSQHASASGYHKATLMLADGSTINLEDAASGILAKQGDSKIEKLVEGQLVYTPSNGKSTEVLINSITTPKGGQYQLSLSDGSRVWLNAASSLRFPAVFSGNERVVELNGEGYFEVAKNTSMPFKVKINGKGEVEVLGTHFNISAYTDEPAMNTTLIEGKVKVTAGASGINKIIHSGEQAELDKTGQVNIIKSVNTEQATAWKNGSFNFDNADLGEVMRQLARWYDVDVKFETAIPKRKFEGEIQRDLTLTQVLKLLERNNIPCKLVGKTLIVLK
jgi:transmembrane sensor